MAVNNEIGTIQPIEEAAELLKKYPKIHFHIDAVQGIGKGIQEKIFNERVDFVTISGHKFHAPLALALFMVVVVDGLRN